MKDLQGNTLIRRDLYSFNEIAKFENEYKKNGYRIHHRIASIPNITVVELENGDELRKQALMAFIMELSTKEKALWLAYLTKRITQITLSEIWIYPNLQKAFKDLREVQTSIWDFEDDMIVALRATII
jgi:hypothetical protein